MLLRRCWRREISVIIGTALIFIVTCLLTVSSRFPDRFAVMKRSLDSGEQIVVETEDDNSVGKSKALSDLYISNKISSAFLKRVATGSDRSKCEDLVSQFLQRVVSVLLVL